MKGVEKHFWNVMKQDAGAKYYKVDLHIHTPSSIDQKYRFNQKAAVEDIDSGYERARGIAEQILDELVAKEISVAAFTDHNSPGFVNNADFSSLSWYMLIKLVYDQHRSKYPELLLLPGVEISSDRIHILGIFDDQDPFVIYKIASLLRSVDIRENEFGEVDRVFGTKSIWEVADAIDEMGGICIPAHINASENTRSLLVQYKPPDMEIVRLVQHRAIHVFGVVPSTTRWPDQRSYGSILEKKTFKNRSGATVSYHDWMVERRKEVPQHLPALGYMMNSDAHSVSKIGERFSWVKMGDLSFRSLASALRNPAYCIHENRVKPVSQVRSHVLGVSMEGGFADGLCLRFNEHFNCIVARPSAGKTTLMRVIGDTFWGKRLGLRVRDELEQAVNGIADGLWEVLKPHLLTTGGKLRDMPQQSKTKKALEDAKKALEGAKESKEAKKALEDAKEALEEEKEALEGAKKALEEAKKGLEDTFLENRDLPWTVFVFFSQAQPGGDQVIYAAERTHSEGIHSLDGREDYFRYYESDVQPGDLDLVEAVRFSEIGEGHTQKSGSAFREILTRPGFYFGRVGLGDEEQNFCGARGLLDNHLLRVMDGYTESRNKLFTLCRDLEGAAGKTPPDTAAIAARAAEVRQLLGKLYDLRDKFAKRFNETEQEHALRIAFRKGEWQAVVANTPQPDQVSDYVHNIRQYLHGYEYYDVLEMTFYQKRATRGGEHLEKVPFSQLTSARRSLMALRLLLNSSFEMAPVFVDGPERWLNNEALVEFCDLRRRRDDQLIFLTQNPNIAVLGNAEQTVILDVDRGRTQVLARGGLDKKLEKKRKKDEDRYVADEAIRLLEGGTMAFQRKLLRYQAELRRLGLRVELQRPEKT